MKKTLFLVPLAALALAACSNDEVTEQNTTQNQPKEIAFSPLAQKTTRAAILDGTFPTTSDIIVAAYDAGKTANFFNATTFKYNYAGGASGSSGKWGAETTAKYWPLAATTINFLAYANFTAGTATWDATNYASQVTLAMADNSSTQNDLMYAVGQGAVTQSGNALVIPEKVDMAFMHAQSLLEFNVKANVASTITLKRITLNNAYFSGTFTVDNSTNYNQTSAQAVNSVAWSSLGDQKATLDIFSGSYDITTSSEKKAEIMVVPHPSEVSFDSFTLTYAIGGVEYTYTFTPVDRNLASATKYVYDINFTLHEIFINATVTSWTDGGTNHVEVPTKSFAYVASTGVTGTYTLPSATAGTYTVTITGLPADTYTVEEGDTGTDFITDIKPSSAKTISVGEALDISFTVTASPSNSRTILIKNDESTPETLFTLTVTQP